MNKANLKLIGILVVIGLVVTFVIQNVATVEIRFLFWSLPMPRALMIFVVLCLGVIVGWLLRGVLRNRRARAR